MAKALDKVAERAATSCDRKHKGLHEQQDCIQGVNIARRQVKKRGLSVGISAALRICENEQYRGPRGRCWDGVILFMKGATR